MITLIPSPLLGPAVWLPVAEELRRRGRAVSALSLEGPVTDPADVVREILAGLPEDEPTVLVPHSNAGLYIAPVATARPVEGVVFVDAGLPSRGPTTPTAPPALREHLAALVDADGSLPPWTQWWPDVSELFPDRATQQRVEVEQSRLPLSYFHGAVPSPPAWEALPAAYLSFGETYADEREEARRRGWPVERLDGRHLHMLVEPVTVARSVERLARCLKR